MDSISDSDIAACNFQVLLKRKDLMVLKRNSGAIPKLKID
jgi:hypothetical protein